MRVLLTGGSGFIGRHVKERLSLDHERVLAPTHVELDLDEYHGRRHVADAIIRSTPSSIRAVKPGHRNAPDQTGLAGKISASFSASCDRGRGSAVSWSRIRRGIRCATAAGRRNRDRVGEEVPTDDHGFSKYVEAMWLARDPNAVELRPFGSTARARTMRSGSSRTPAARRSLGCR